MTMNGVPFRCAFAPRMLRCCRNPTTGPSSAKIAFQARVRSRKLMKKGAITRMSASACQSGYLRSPTPMK